MAEFSGGSTALRGARSTTKDSTVYSRGGYRAAPPIYETGDDGNLRQTTGNPARAAQPAADTGAPAFTKAFADVPRPQGSSLAGSLAQTALGKAAEKGLPKLFSAFANEDVSGLPVGGASYGPGGITNDVADAGIGPAANTRFGNPGFLTARDTGAGSLGTASDLDGVSIDPDAGSLGSYSDMGDGAAGWVSGADLPTGSVDAWTSGADLVDGAGAVGDAAGGIPYAGAFIKAAQGDVKGAALSGIGFAIGGPIGGFIGGVISSVFGGDSVVCTELRRQGLIDARLVRYNHLVRITPAQRRGYHWWGIPLVRAMRRSRFWTRVGLAVMTTRGLELAYRKGWEPRPCWTGKAVIAVTDTVSAVIGHCIGEQDYQSLYRQGEPA